MVEGRFIRDLVGDIDGYNMDRGIYPEPCLPLRVPAKWLKTLLIHRTPAAVNKWPPGPLPPQTVRQGMGSDLFILATTNS